MYWYLEVLRKYTVFSGRSRRKEFWMFSLISGIIALGLAFIDIALGLDFGSDFGAVSGVLSSLYSLGVLVPNVAVTVRRLHDTGRSGWWVLISFIPLVGLIVLLIFMVQDSKDGENEHGPNPKAEAAY